ncbi:PfaB family protein [Nostoc sp. HG1]|nr:PfaB family protein [Nostoc sp. HG1]
MTVKLAIVGIEAFFGTCHGLDKFERSIYDATQYFIPIPPIRRQAIQPKLAALEEEEYYNNQALLGAYIQDFEIDAFHFKIPPNEIDKHDPKQLLMLKVIDQALRDAKLDQQQKRLQNVAIVAVIKENPVNELDRKLVETGDNDNTLSEKTNTVFQKISTLWNTSGPNFVVNGKENSVFEALEIAKTLLTVGPVDCVVVSAVNFAGELDCVMSGKATLSYDCNASGSIVGEGAGAIVLKRYEKAKHDRDRIYAVIDTVSNLSESSTNPAESVKQSCHKAFAKAGVSPADIGYLEVFASGDEQQDEAEILGLIQAYQVPNSELSCAIGSVKTNIGHTYIASGIASLIKTALCLHNRYIPATPQWTSPKNPEIWQDSPFYVPTESRPWFLNSGQTTRVAAINSLASDGTYAHIILSEDSSSQDCNHRYLEQSPFYLFAIAANNQSGLLEQLETLEQTIKNSSSLSTVASQTFATFQNNSQAIYALAIVGHNQDELLREIQRGRKGIPNAFACGKDWKSPSGSYFTAKPQGKQGHIAFIYPGAFNSYIGMGRKLFYFFPKTFERATSFVSQANLFFREKLLYPRSLNQISKRQLEDIDAKLLDDPLSMQVSGTGFSVLLTHILRDYFQIQPQAAFGYSMGESTMLYSLNVWTSGDNVNKFVHSSELFQTRLVGAKKTVRDYWGLPENPDEDEAVWHSYVLMAPLSSVVSRLKQETQVYLTNINTPNEVVIAGEPEACQRAIADLNCDAFRAPADLVLHCEPMASEYDQLIKLNTSPTQNVSGINFYSSANYDLMPLDKESLAHRVSQGFCQRVDFPRLLNQVYEDGARIFIEVGPGNTCSRWIADNLQQKEHVTISINRRGADDYTGIVKALAQLLSHGASVDLSPLYRTTEKSSNQKKSFLKNISLKKYPLMPTSLSVSNNKSGENVDSISLSKTTVSACKKSDNVIFDEIDVLEFAQGQVSKVLGKDYEIIDPYPRRVRLPSPPYLFISRVNKIEGVRGEYGSGFVQTEYDLSSDAWFAVDGQIPIGIYEEAGQGFLLLLGYLGTDFDNQGQRSFRLLDLTATFLSDQPEDIKTMRYDVKINSAVKTASNLVVFFSGECFINEKLFLKISGGCAGLFSDEELEQGQGIIFTERDEKERSQIQKQYFQPLLSCKKSTFDRQDLLHLTQGNIAACFGTNYQQNGLNPSLRLPSEKLLMFDKVLSIDPQGGAAGLGLVTATKTVEPSDWYFLCHFKNDPTMPGSLMVEGSSQLLQFYLLFLGLQTCTNNARFQAIAKLPQIVRFRGQVTPGFGTLTYRVEVIKMERSPQPFAIANVEIIYGNKTIAYIRNLGLQLSEKPENPLLKLI